MTEWVSLLGGGVLLYFGAEWFVGGASSLAMALRVPQLIVGLTVVAYGTSAPEAVVGMDAAASGHGDVALANVVGSNIANVGLVLGLSVLLRPATVAGDLRRRELPVLVASAAALVLVVADGRVARAEGLVLIGCSVLYTAWMVIEARASTVVTEARAAAVVTGQAVDAAGAPAPGGPGRAAATAAVGLALLLLGGRLFVDGAVGLARAWGTSDRLVGLTIVAVGTSLPELVTSLIAARRGHSDIAIGNVIGSNVFNVLICLGGAAVVAPIVTDVRRVAVDLWVFVVLTLLLSVLIRGQRTISRAEGLAALLLYVVFVAWLVAGGG